MAIGPASKTDVPPQSTVSANGGRDSRSTRTRRATSFVIIGLLLATLGFGLTFYLGTQLAASTPTVEVLVAARALPAGTGITPADVKTRSYLASTAPASALHSSADVVGRIARVDIAAGDPILSSTVGSVSEGIAPTNHVAVPPGYAAVQLTVPAPAGGLAVGEYVDVIATVNLSLFKPGAPGSASRVVFPSLEVVHAAGASQQSQQPTLVTVLMNECDVPYAAWLASNATLTVALLPLHQGALPSADATCTGLVTNRAIGAGEVDARYHFSS